AQAQRERSERRLGERDGKREPDGEGAQEDLRHAGTDASRIAARMPCPVLPHENSRARAIPRAPKSFARASSEAMRAIACAMAAESSGLTINAASPTTSGSDDVFDVITGVPQAMASSAV